MDKINQIYQTNYINQINQAKGYIIGWVNRKINCNIKRK